MNKFVYFMAVGLAFTFLQVTTVSADTAAGLVTGGANAPADCGGVPCPTGDDAGMAPGTVRMCGDVPCATDGGGDALGGQGGEDCAILPNADLVRECVARRTAGGNSGGTGSSSEDRSCMALADGSLPPHCQ